MKRLLLPIFLSFLSSFAYGKPKLDDLTQELFKIMVSSSYDDVMDFKRVQELVESGADIHARDVSDAYPLLLAVESFAYMSGNPAYKPEAMVEAKKVIQFLISKGSDVSSQDGRSITPIQYLFFYGRNFKEVFDYLLEAKPDLGIAGNEDGYTLIHLLSRVGWQSELETILNKKEIYKVNVAALDLRGLSVLHYSAGAKRKANGILPLEYMANLLEEKTRTNYIDRPDVKNWSPLIYAVRAKNYEGVEYLVNNFSVDVNRLTDEGESPLEIAHMLGDTKTADYLKVHGAKEREAKSGILCDQPNALPFSFETLKEALTVDCKGKIQTVEAALQILPLSMKSNYSLIYNSRSLQKASFSHPRTTLYGRDAKFVVAFNGDPKFNGYNKLEMYQFDSDSKKFEYFDIIFDGGAPKISEANPALCLNCHRNSPRPNWDHWNLWSGVYRGDMESMYAEERKKFSTYLAVKDEHPRYKQLLPITYGPVTTYYGSYSLTDNANFKLDVLIQTLVAEKVSREIKETSKLQPLRYALLGALSCREEPSEFLSDEHKGKMPKEFGDILKETREFAVAEYQDRIARQSEVMPGGAVGRYIRWPFRSPDNFGNNLDTLRIAALRYLVEGTLGTGSMDGWFFRFDNNKNRYSALIITSIEGMLWKNLLDPEKDKEIYDIYAKVFPKIQNVGYATSWIYGENGEAAKLLCPKLIEKSRAAGLKLRE